MFAVSFALANATYWMNARGSRHAAVVTVVLWWLSATFALAIYLRFRWAGLADLGMRLMRRFNVLKRWQKKSSSPGAEVQGTEHLRRNRGVETSR
jgi:hypothetical protein